MNKYKWWEDYVSFRNRKKSKLCGGQQWTDPQEHWSWCNHVNCTWLRENETQVLTCAVHQTLKIHYRSKWPRNKETNTCAIQMQTEAEILRLMVSYSIPLRTVHNSVQGRAWEKWLEFAEPRTVGLRLNDIKMWLLTLILAHLNILLISDFSSTMITFTSNFTKVQQSVLHSDRSRCPKQISESTLSMDNAFN